MTEGIWPCQSGYDRVRRCVTSLGLALRFQKPIPGAVYCLSVACRLHVSSELLPQSHACLPAALHLTMMAMEQANGIY